MSTYNIRFWSKTSYTLIVRLFAPSLAFEIIGPTGLIIAMGIHYLLTSLTSWIIHFNINATHWVKIRLSFFAMAFGGVTLVIGGIKSNAMLVLSSAGFFGIYEALFWTSFHAVREIEHGLSESVVADWNFYEKLLAFILLLFTSLFIEYGSSEFCIVLGIIVALIGAHTISRRIEINPLVDGTIISYSRPHFIPIALPFIEGMAAVSWIFYMRLAALDGSFIDIPLIGSGAAALARIMGLSSLFGAFVYYISTKYEWDFNLKKTIPLQIIIIVIMILSNNLQIQFFSVLLMSVLRTLMFGQAVHKFRQMLAVHGCAHDTRERLKFTGRVMGIFMIMPLYNSVVSILIFHLFSLIILIFLFLRGWQKDVDK